MARIELPIGIQDAPEYIGIGLGVQSNWELADSHPNFIVLRAEGCMLTIRSAIESVGERLAGFNGRGGLALIAKLQVGGAGMHPATDTLA